MNKLTTAQIRIINLIAESAKGYGVVSNQTRDTGSTYLSTGAVIEAPHLHGPSVKSLEARGLVKITEGECRYASLTEDGQKVAKGEPLTAFEGEPAKKVEPDAPALNEVQQAVVNHLRSLEKRGGTRAKFIRVNIRKQGVNVSEDRVRTACKQLEKMDIIHNVSDRYDRALWAFVTDEDRERRAKNAARRARVEAVQAGVRKALGLDDSVDLGYRGVSLNLDDAEKLLAKLNS